MPGKILLALGDYRNNYGTVLQAFATYRKISDMGYDAEAIDFTNLKKSIRNRKLRYFAGKIFDASVIQDKGRIAVSKFYKLFNPEYRRGHSRRGKLFDTFRREMIKRSRPFESWDDLSESCRRYSAVLVGSDQVWLPSQIIGDFFTLNFVPDEVKRISYASSFGVSYVEKAQEDKARKFLSRINHLSVREKSGQEIVKRLTGRDAELVCDPTLLLTADEWNTALVNRSSIEQGRGDYVFCYFLGVNDWQRKFVRELADKVGLPVIALPNLDQYIPYDNSGWAEEMPYDISPSDFLRLLKNATYVCTDSFHGTMFSLIFGKKFFTFRRFPGKETLSTNTRIESAAENFGIKSRLASENDTVDSMLARELDFQSVQKRIHDFRESSLKFLRESLEAQS